MRNLTLRICFLFPLMWLSVNLYSSDKVNKGDRTITSRLDEYRVEQGKGMATHVVRSERAQRCDFSFLALPAGDTLGYFSTYTLTVNGVQLFTPITFTEPGWQEAHTTKQSILLNKGQNIISFTSNGRDLPQIRQIEYYTGARRFASATSALSSFYTAQNNTALGSLDATFNTASTQVIQQIPPPLYRYGAQMDQPYSYTFFLPIEYKAGDRASFYSPTSWDPRYGRYATTADFHLYLFHENPAMFSESTASNNKSLFWSVDIERSGTYYVLLEAQYPLPPDSIAPYATLLINNNMLYAYNYVSSTTAGVHKDSPMGQMSVSNRDSCYNMFTVNPRSSSTYTEADPCLWLKKVDYLTDKTTIVAYSDNNNIVSDFDWGKNARIRTLVSDNYSYEVLLSSAKPMFAEKDTCDLYHAFWNTPHLAGMLQIFPNLKDEDVIESGKPTPTPLYPSDDPIYNCVAWSGGVNDVMAWPIEGYTQDTAWFDAFYNNEWVQIEDRQIKRPNGSLRYTREGATEENSVIDLWPWI